MSWTHVHEVDRKAAAVLPPPFSRDAASGVLDLGHIPKEAVFIAHQPQFKSILGPSPKLSLIAEEGWACFHEAGIYDPHRGSIFITSNRITGEQHENQHIAVTEVPLADPSARKQLSPSEHGVVMANGGTNYKDGYLFCDQGYGESQPSSLVFVAPSKDGHSLDSQVILNNYHGRPFNSLNDVVVHRDGSIWFTDPDYGSEQSFKPAPQLPNQVYRFDPATSDIRVVAAGIEKCNGILFSPDFATCYISDTAFISGTGKTDPRKGGHIYAYDIRIDANGRSSTLQNKRVFAFTDAGAPDGMKCDTDGNVYAGCFDGVHVWSREGELVGKILLPNGDGCANLVFGPPGRLYIFAETRLYEVQLSAKGVLVE